MTKLTELLNEEPNMSPLGHALNAVIDDINSDTDYKEFADAVAEVLREEYGEHLFKSFITHLTRNLASK